MKLQKKVAAALLAGSLCCGGLFAEAADRETVYQVALLQSLTQGYFDGVISVKELKSLGDTGIGTFKGLDGEMIVLDGVVYQAKGDGSVVVVSNDVTVPFSNVTFFEQDAALPLYKVTDKADLEERLNRFVEDRGRNNFYMVKITGTFDTMYVRSEHGQKEPYPTLVQALAKDQTEFSFDNIRGTVVGLYCPDYMGGLNTPGWHFHFLSEDKKKGGHVLGLSAAKAEAAIDVTKRFTMKTPDEKNFHKLRLAEDLKEEIRKAEQASKEDLE